MNAVVVRYLCNALPVWMLAALAMPCAAALRQGTGWLIANERVLASPNPEQDGNFGVGLAVEGDTVVVGASAENGSATDSGTAYVFERSAAGWTTQELIPSSPLPAGAAFGYRADVSGDVVAIGAIYDRSLAAPSLRCGAVHIFECDSGGNWLQVQRLENPSPADSDFYGHGVALNGARLLVGAHLNDEPGKEDCGAAYLYEHGPNGWALIHTFMSPFQSQGGGFGAFVGLMGSRVVIGAPGEYSGAVRSGAIYIFDETGTGWVHSRLLAPTPSDGGEFGYYVDLDPSWIVVGEFFSDDSGVAGGAVHVYSNGAAPALEATIWPSTIDAGDGFCAGLNVANNTIVVGAPGDDEAGSNSGSLFVFDRVGSTWVERPFSTACGYQPEMRYGDGLAFDGTSILAGATERDLGGVPQVGLAYVLRTSTGSFSTFCGGNGAGNQCPCNNNGPTTLGDGCLNTHSVGGRLSARGSDSAASDDLELVACNLPPGQFGLLFTGTSQLNAGLGIQFGNGLRCVGGQITRRGSPRISDSFGVTTWGPGLSTFGAWVVGQPTYFQVWYRNPGPTVCESHNVTNAVGVVYAP